MRNLLEQLNILFVSWTNFKNICVIAYINNVVTIGTKYCNFIY